MRMLERAVETSWPSNPERLWTGFVDASSVRRFPCFARSSNSVSIDLAMS